jgi:polar amino acid transport system substrate-binding protein
MRLPTLVAVNLLMSGFSALQAVAEDSVTVSTLEWPPYTSAELPLGGAVSDIVVRAFGNIGVEADVLTLPWQRAVSTASDSDDVAAYFPGYHCRHMEGFVASEPVGFGPLGLVENTNAPITWSTVDNLGEQELLIGTVLGYANTDEFDRMAQAGAIDVAPASDDLTNLRRLLRQRIDAAVIDRLVLAYLLATEPSLADGREQLVFDERPLSENTLYVCFNDDEEGRALRDRFNEGLAGIDVEQTIDAYFSEQF